MGTIEMTIEDPPALPDPEPGTSEPDATPTKSSSFVLLDDESILEGFSYSGSRFKLQSTSDGRFIYTQALSVIVIPNDATVDSNDFHDLLIKFERDEAQITASL